MKHNIVRGGILVAFAAASLGLVACDNAAVSPDDPAPIVATPATSFELNATPSEFNDATLEQPVGERPQPGSQVRTPFGELLRVLNLTEEQRQAASRMLEAHKDCVKAALEELRAAEREILQAAREASKEIIEKAKAGEITREEARAALRQINARTREALKSLGAREKARAAMKACDEAFIQQLTTILSEEQLVTLRRWLASKNGGTPPGGGRDTGNPGGGRDTTNTGGGRGRG